MRSLHRLMLFAMAAAGAAIVAASAVLSPAADASAESGDGSDDESRDNAAAALVTANDAVADGATRLLARSGDPSLALADALGAIDAAAGAAALSAPRRYAARTQRAIGRARRRCEKALAELGDAEPPTDARAMQLISRCADALAAARRAVGPRGDVNALVLSSRRALVARPGRAVSVRVRVAPGCQELVEILVTNDEPSVLAVSPFVADRGRNRYRITFGADAGTATFSATACGATATLTLLNQGASDVLDLAPPTALSYGAAARVRVGDALSFSPTYDGGDATYSVTPPLPDGVVLDAATGAVSGSPLAIAAEATFDIVARNARGLVHGELTFTVDAPLPPEVSSLVPGFTITKVVDADNPVRMALAPDGRIFYGEFLTGDVRVIDAAGTLRAQPFASVPVVLGGERGLFGIALAPDFEVSGHVFVCSTSAADAGHPVRTRVVRFTAGSGGASGGGNVAVVGPDVIIDDLPLGDAQNGGAIEFGPDGKLYVTTGDTGDMELSQTDGSLAGRVLRYNPDGTTPDDGVIPGSPEFARGFRNPFDLTFHPLTGGLFVSENGPTAHDELNFVQSGRNCEWGALPDSVPGPTRGRRIIDWTPVIVPTGIIFHDGTGFGPAYADTLFVAGYDRADVRQLALSGPARTDLDQELPFLQFDETGFGNKPLDLQLGPDGSLFISTFSAIWRVSKD